MGPTFHQAHKASPECTVWEDREGEKRVFFKLHPLHPVPDKPGTGQAARHLFQGISWLLLCAKELRVKKEGPDPSHQVL